MKAQEQKSSMEQKGEKKKDKTPNQNLIGLHKKKKPTHLLFAHTDVLST